MSFRQITQIAGSALTAQTVRMNTISSNLANAQSASGSDAATYRARFALTPPARQRVGPVLSGGGGEGPDMARAGIAEAKPALGASCIPLIDTLLSVSGVFVRPP